MEKNEDFKERIKRFRNLILISSSIGALTILLDLLNIALFKITTISTIANAVVTITLATSNFFIAVIIILKIINHNNGKIQH